MPPMNWIDILVLLIVGYNIVTGLKNGLLRSLGHLLALGGAFVFTPVVKFVVIRMVTMMFDLPQHLAIPVGMAVTWMGIYILISIVVHIVSKAVDATPLKIMNRLGGLGLGLLMSGAVILFPLAVIDSFPILREQPAIQAKLSGAMFWEPVLKPATYYTRTVLGPSILGMWLGSDQEKLKQVPGATPSGPPSKAKLPNKK